MSAIESARFHVYVFEGGSRSSKTFSIIQHFIIFALSHRDSPTRVVISRKKATWLATTVWSDFLKILMMSGLYEKVRINRTLKTIRLCSTVFEFIGLDDVQRLHGLTCDICWINEAIEATRDDFDQLEQRTSRFCILDYNPSAEEHWIYDNVCKREDCYFDHSTMLDNPFIPDNSRRKILSYEPTPENYEQGTADERKWKIYGLGQRAKIEGLIFPEYTLIEEIPAWVTKRWYSLDFGFTNDPTACAEVGFYNNALFIDEKFYATNMLSKDIIREFKKLKPLLIVSESADPRLVRELQLADLLIYPVQKYAGSIKAGIDFMKGLKIYITSRSVNAIKEFDNYTYLQDANGRWLNDPEDDYNHIIDGVRYVCLEKLMGRSRKKKKPIPEGIFR